MKNNNKSSTDWRIYVDENVRSGVVEFLILHLLTERDMYGYELRQELEERTKGVYVLTGFVRFNANENGYRYANFNTTSGAISQQVNDTHPNANYVTQLNLSMCVSVDAETTMYLNAYQNSGSDLTCPSGGTFIRVVKVA